MSYCPQCGAECVNAAYCIHCGASVRSNVGVAAVAQDFNPFAVGSQTSAETSRSSDSEAPDIPGFGGAITTCLKKYCCFKGRASRSEYWYWALFNFLVGCGLGFCFATDEETLSMILFLWGLGVFLPSIAASVRRLHDVGRSGWDIFIVMVFGFVTSIGARGGNMPFLSLLGYAGSIYLLVQYCRPGTLGENQYGLEPQKRS